MLHAVSCVDVLHFEQRLRTAFRADYDVFMSFDFSVVVRGRKQKPDDVRKFATKLARSYDASLVEDENDEEGDQENDNFELRFAFPKGGGTIEITRLQKGYLLNIDSQCGGNRDSWDDIGGLMLELAPKLGTDVDEETAAKMIEESYQGAETPEHASVAVIVLEDSNGAILDESRMGVSQLQAYIDPGGMLRDCTLHSMLTEDGRYAARAAKLVALLHDSKAHRCDVTAGSLMAMVVS
jgi:hypothetical protein